jgi:hypothetical protein
VPYKLVVSGKYGEGGDANGGCYGGHLIGHLFPEGEGGGGWWVCRAVLMGVRSVVQASIMRGFERGLVN